MKTLISLLLALVIWSSTNSRTQSYLKPEIPNKISKLDIPKMNYDVGLTKEFKETSKNIKTLTEAVVVVKKCKKDSLRARLLNEKLAKLKL